MIANALLGVVVLSFVFVPVERLWPVRRGQRLLREGLRTDLLHFVLTGTLTTIGLAVAAIPVVVVLGLTTPGWLRDAVRSQPSVVQLGEALLVVELAGYWMHRAAHTYPALWRLHRVHHSSPRMDWLAAAHLHPLDQTIARLAAVVPLFVLGFSRATFGGTLVLLQIHAIFQHANVRLSLGPLGHVVSTPHFHHWHHTNDPEARDKNFAGLFPWLDRLFGTHHAPAGAWPRSYGIDDPMPAGYLGQLASPFARRPAPRPPAPRARAAGAPTLAPSQVS